MTPNPRLSSPAAQDTPAALIPALRSIYRRVTRLLNTLIVLGVRLVLLIALLLGLDDGKVQITTLRGQVTALARDHLFNYVAWEVSALWDKAGAELLGVSAYLSEDDARPIVLDYLGRLSAAQALDAQIEAIYADPEVGDPAAASATLRAGRDALRADLAGDQRLVESVIESQVSSVLVAQGFGVLGQVLPPVAMHFSELPTVLVVSPRDRIEFAVDVSLDPLPVDQRDALESRVDAALDVSSLIVPIGGMSLYPSMIIEPGSRDLAAKTARAIEVTAHEWAHHYLMFYPLGLEYATRPETRIINETTATFFGRAVARDVMVRYYPDLPSPQYPSFLDTSQPTAAPTDSAAAPTPATDPNAPPPFDYAREMHATRTRVDFLLWQGMVDAAETYMQAQQRKFARNGYPIRKLNQAYFAFYGGYQGAPGAGGSDPTGAAIETILRDSATLEDFLRAVRSITTRADLLAAAGME